ncbi:hypothetical protein ABFA07_001239 [Porites harrisoni]
MEGMLEEHRNIITSHRADLVKDLEPSKVLNDLSECLDEDDREVVKAQGPRKACAEELVDMIPRRGPKAFHCFVAALYKRQRHLAIPLMQESGIDSSSFEKGQLTATANPTLPYKGAHFKGRELVVQEIVQELTKDPNPSRVIIIVGIPGMGKTQVAIHVSHLLKEEHKKAVVFIEEKQKLTEICSEILREINPLAPRLSESHDMIAIAKRRLKELKEKKVIVLDSVEGIQQQGEEFDDFLRYVETYAPLVQLIITTREYVGFRSSNICNVRLDRLDSESSAKLLQDLVPNCEERHIKELGNLCGGIPLVLVNCAGLLEEGFSPENLVARLKENPIPLFKTIAEDVYNSLRQFLVNISENTKANLVRLSVFPSAFSVEDMKALFGDVLEPEAVKNTMIRRSLLRRIDDEKLILHPLVREFLKAERKLLNMDVVGEKAQHKFNQHYLELLETSSKQFVSKEWSQNAISTFRTEKANILEVFKNFLQEGGDKKEAESCIDVANSTKVLDFLAKVLSPPSECVELYERCCHIAEASNDTRRLADSLTALGFLRLCKEAHRGVSPDTVGKFQRAYEIRKDLPKDLQYCETHAHTISKLGLCYALQGEVRKGLKLIQEAVDLRKELGVRLYVAAGYCDLGNAHRASKNHKQAIDIWKTETLPVYKDVLGDHPWTASILRYIAGSYRCLAKSESVDSGMADQAVKYSREALELRNKLLGEHHDTARSHVDLSDSLIIKAIKQLEEAIEIQKKVLGEDHETTEKTISQLGKLKSMIE